MGCGVGVGGEALLLRGCEKDSRNDVGEAECSAEQRKKFRPEKKHTVKAQNAGSRRDEVERSQGRQCNDFKNTQFIHPSATWPPTVGRHPTCTRHSKSRCLPCLDGLVSNLPNAPLLSPSPSSTPGHPAIQKHGSAPPLAFTPCHRPPRASRPPRPRFALPFGRPREALLHLLRLALHPHPRLRLRPQRRRRGPSRPHYPRLDRPRGL